MKMSRIAPAKIVNHSSGLGTPSPETVRQRAIELARINGHETYTDDDWKQAKRELHGGRLPTDNGEDEMIESVSERDMVAGGVGHHADKTRYDDSENIGEELVAEGMDEAVHDRMLQ